ncbi:MAG: CoA-binding protein [Dehalococcoidia bacterium]|nr:CoA-binding protein [Dehalococcoidia bacterium]
MITAPDLTRLFSPRSVAIAGASATVDSPGHDYVHSLRVFGFEGEVYPISRSAAEVDGYRAYASLDDVPGEVDLVISCLPSSAVLGLVAQCAAKHVPFLHLFTGRFSETGDAEAADLERRLLAACEEGGVRLLGPNGLGLYHPGGRIAFRPDLPREPGGVAFLSQSGNNAVEVALRGNARGLRFGKVANYGNGLDLTPARLLAYLADDPDTTVIGAYVEGVPDGRAFFEACKQAAARKPVIIHKAGRTAAGAKSASSHTAALAGSAQLWSAALRQAGALEARSQEQLLDLMVAAALLPKASGRRMAIVGGGGGRSVQSADAAEENGFDVVPLPDAVREQVRAKAPMLADWVGNPVDQSILAGSGLSSNGLLELMLADDAYEVAIANVGEDWFLGRPGGGDRLKHACNRLAAIAANSPKPVAVVLGATETNEPEYRQVLDEVRDTLIARGLAVFPSVERAAWAVGVLSAEC